MCCNAGCQQCSACTKGRVHHQWSLWSLNRPAVHPPQHSSQEQKLPPKPHCTSTNATTTPSVSAAGLRQAMSRQGRAEQWRLGISITTRRGLASTQKPKTPLLSVLPISWRLPLPPPEPVKLVLIQPVAQVGQQVALHLPVLVVEAAAVPQLVVTRVTRPEVVAVLPLAKVKACRGKVAWAGSGEDNVGRCRLRRQLDAAAAT